MLCYKDKDDKKLYVDELDNELYKLYKRVDLTIDYDKKDFVKENDGRWDHQNKTWFTYQSNEKLNELFKN